MPVGLRALQSGRMATIVPAVRYCHSQREGAPVLRYRVLRGNASVLAVNLIPVKWQDRGSFLDVPAASDIATRRLRAALIE